MTPGFSLIELMVAMTIAALTVTGVVVFLAGDQSISIDTVTNIDALHKVQDLIESVSAHARVNYTSVTASTVLDCSDGLCYTSTVTLPVSYATQCKQAVVGRVSWSGTQNRSLSVSATTTIVNIPEMIALGGVCDFNPPTSGWNPPSTFASSNFNPGKPTGIDVLDKIVYMSSDATPFLHIADTRTAVLGQSSGLFVSTGSFDAGVKLNDIRVARVGKSIYAYVVKDSATLQFAVIDVSNINAPVTVATRSLTGVAGAQPEGFRIYHYDARVYIVTQRTAGPEFHIFDISNPLAPMELGSGFELNRTVESLVVTKKTVAGVSRLYAFMAADLDSAELSVLDVTNPSSITQITHADHNLPGNQDGSTVFLVGNHLYFGRLSVPGVGEELYVYDASSPATGLRIVAKANIGTSVLGIAVSGPLAFLATAQANNQFKVYQSDPNSLISVNTNFNFPDLVENGVRYASNFVYVASKGNDAIRILYSI